jgi:hypothetical protein
MPQIKMSADKGVVQSSGSGLVLSPAAVVDVTDDLTNGKLVLSQPYHLLSNSDNAVSLVIPALTDADVGQLLVLSHVGAGANNKSITLQGLGVSLDAGESVMLVWTGLDLGWSLTSQTLA